MPLNPYVADADNAAAPADTEQEGTAARELRAVKAKLNEIQAASRPITTGGSSSAYLVPSLASSLRDNAVYQVIAHTTNANSTTLTPGAGAVLPIVQMDGITPIVAGQMQQGYLYLLRKIVGGGLVLLNPTTVFAPFLPLTSVPWDSNFRLQQLDATIWTALLPSSNLTIYAYNLYCTNASNVDTYGDTLVIPSTWNHINDGEGAVYIISDKGTILLTASSKSAGALATLTVATLSTTTQVKSDKIITTDFLFGRRSVPIATWATDSAAAQNRYVVNFQGSNTPVDKKVYEWIPHLNNTGASDVSYEAPTLNGKALKLYPGSSLFEFITGSTANSAIPLANMIVSGRIYEVMYIAAVDEFWILNSPGLKILDHIQAGSGGTIPGRTLLNNWQIVRIGTSSQYYVGIPDWIYGLQLPIPLRTNTSVAVSYATVIPTVIAGTNYAVIASLGIMGSGEKYSLLWQI